MDDVPPSLFDALGEQQIESTLSISQLFMRVKKAIASEFRDEIWVTGEVKSIREWNAAWFINLVEPGATRGGGDVNVDVACWQRAPIQAQLADAGITLSAGMEVRVRGTVGISKLGKVQITLTELDTEALLGRVAQEKQRLIRQLVEEKIFDRNRGLLLSPVPLRIGFVSSVNSEGYNDFLGQLRASPYAFHVIFEHSPVQGMTAPMLLAQAINRLQSQELDMIAVVRGGGGELDAYDKEPIVRAIALSNVPVWVGVGHTGDRSVSDDVAHQSHITPTACGQAIVRRVKEYADNIDVLRETITDSVLSTVQQAMVDLAKRTERVQRSVQRDIMMANSTLHSTAFRVHSGAVAGLVRAQSRVMTAGENARHHVTMNLIKAEGDLATRQAKVEAFNPVKQLQRGFSLTLREDGSLVRSIADVEPDDLVRTEFSDGTVTSRVIKKGPTHD